MTSPATLRLGKRAARKDSRTLRLAKYLPDRLPTARDAVDWCSKVANWPMFKNDQIGDCTCAAAAHLFEAWTAYAGQKATLTDEQVLAAYSAVTGYDPAQPETDRGAVELDVLKYLRQAGIGGHTIDAFADVSIRSLNEVKIALDWFGGLYIGLALPASAQDQDIWDVVRGSGSGAGSWGGHAVNVQAYDADGLTCVTWGATKRMTWRFWAKYCDEAYALLSKDRMTSAGVDPAGLDWATLQADLIRLARAS